MHLVRVSLRDCWRLALSPTYAGVTLRLGAAIMRLDVIVLSTVPARLSPVSSPPLKA